MVLPDFSLFVSKSIPKQDEPGRLVDQVSVDEFPLVIELGSAVSVVEEGEQYGLDFAGSICVQSISETPIKQSVPLSITQHPL